MPNASNGSSCVWKFSQNAQTTIVRLTGILRGEGGAGTCKVLPYRGAIP